MRTVFIVNPKAGKGRGREKFIKEIEAASKRQVSQLKYTAREPSGTARLWRRSSHGRLRRAARKRASSLVVVTGR